MFRLKDPSGLYWAGAHAGVTTKSRKALHFKTREDALAERSCVQGVQFPLCTWTIVRVITL